MAIQEAEKPEEVKDMFMRVCGYLKCCIDAEFIDKESAEEVMDLVCKLAASEEARLIMKGMEGGNDPMWLIKFTHCLLCSLPGNVFGVLEQYFGMP